MDRKELIRDIKGLMISQLALNMDATDILDDVPLFGPVGVGIEPPDGVLICNALEARYSVRIPLHTEEGQAAMSSVNALADHILKYGFTGE